MWLTIKEIQKQVGISYASIRKRITKNTVNHKKIKNVVWIELPPEWEMKINGVENAKEKINQQIQQALNDKNNGEDEYYVNLSKKTQLDNELKIQKLKNLKEDTLIKRQKQQHTKQLYRQQYVDGVFEAFTDSFSGLKNFIIQLKLDKEKNDQFKQVLSKCLKNFQTKLTEYLNDCDKKENQINEEAEEEEER